MKRAILFFLLLSLHRFRRCSGATDAGATDAGATDAGATDDPIWSPYKQIQCLQIVEKEGEFWTMLVSYNALDWMRWHAGVMVDDLCGSFVESAVYWEKERKGKPDKVRDIFVDFLIDKAREAHSKLTISSKVKARAVTIRVNS